MEIFGNLYKYVERSIDGLYYVQFALSYMFVMYFFIFFLFFLFLFENNKKYNNKNKKKLIELAGQDLRYPHVLTRLYLGLSIVIGD